MTFDGSAFRAGRGSDAMPVMYVHDLAQGEATSGTVTVRNPGPATRYFWLSDAGFTERPGDTGGSLTDTLQLTILDVTRADSPASVYRGPVGAVGPRPLGFLAPGASRTYSFTADLPLGGLPPGAPAGFDPYRGATSSLGFAWDAIEGSPAPPRRRARSAGPATNPEAAPPRPRPPARDTRAPRVRLRVPHDQPLLEAASLALVARCSEVCRSKATATVDAAGRSLAAGSPPAARLARDHVLRVRLGRRALANVRLALTHGRPASIRVDVQVHDRAGNSARQARTIRLRLRR